MATTQMTLASERRFGVLVFAGTVSAVPLDAAVSERFLVPIGLGDVLLQAVEVELGAFSGAYVAPAPAYDGPRIYITDPALATVDFCGSVRWVHNTTSGGQAFLTAFVDLTNNVLIRQNDRFIVTTPISAGAGVTATMVMRARGLRLRAP